MRGGKAAAVDAVATKLTGKEMFLRHLVVEEDNPEGEKGYMTHRKPRVTPVLERASGCPEDM